MAGENTVAATTVYAATVVASSGPLAEVFNQLMLVYALMGFGGGIALGLFTRGTPWREIARGGILGSLLAAGIGAATPQIVSAIFDIDIGQVNDNVQLLAAYAFLVGLGQNWIVDRITRGKGGSDADA